MKTTKTDREESLEADEFIWDSALSTEVHDYVGPVLDGWLTGMAGAKLLDIGCGNGSLTARFQKIGLDCTGIDYSESGIQMASKANPDVTFFQSSTDQPLPDNLCNSFDIVTSVEVIEHLLLPRDLFKRAKEALKPNGIFLITTPYHGFLKNLLLALTNKFDSHWHPLRDYGHVKFFSRRTLEMLLDEQGFVIEDFRRVGRIPPLARSMLFKARLK